MHVFKARRGSLSFETCEPRAMLSAVTVSSNSDSGPGSFRAAIEQANENTSINAIVFEPRLNNVRLEDTVTFTGPQSLRIDGNVVSIQSVAAKHGEFDLFKTTGGGDLSLTQLTFSRGAQGVVVEVPLTATGNVRVNLERVTISDNDLFGLHIIDLSEVPPPPEDPDAEPTQIGSTAGISLSVVSSSITGNGTAAHDQDGVRVDERGAGGIKVEILGSHLNGNGAEGIELDEAGPGGVDLNVLSSTFNGNGFVSTDDPEDPDFDDGIDIDEADAGSVKATIAHSMVLGNFDEGIDLNEGGLGDLILILTNSRVSGNTDEGVALEEADGGHLLATLLNVTVSDNGADGVQFEEFDGGDLAVNIANSSITDNGGYGIYASQAQPGNGSIRLLNVSLRRNALGPFNTTIENEDTGELEDSGVEVTRI